MKRLLALVCALWAFQPASAQQLANSNFFNYNLYLINPAYAGANHRTEGSLSHRIQWVGVHGAPVSNFLGVHTRLGQHFGLGAKIVYDKTDLLNRMTGMLSLAYHLQLSDAHSIGLGVSAGLLQNSLRLNDAVVFDPQDDIATSGNLSESAFTVDAGLVYQWKQLELGVSLQQLPASSVVYELPSASGRFELRRQYNGFARYDHPLNDRLHLIPTVLLRANEGGPTQADLIAELEWNQRLRFGAGYRTSAGIITQFGVHLFDRLVAAYSYEFSTSGIASYSSGSHEFLLGFSFARPRKKEAEKVEEMATLPVVTEPISEEAVEEDTVLTKDLEPLEQLAPEADEAAEGEEGVAENVTTENEEEKEVVVKQEEKAPAAAERKPTKALSFLDKVVLFELDQTELTAESRNVLSSIAKELREAPDQRINVVGHTCDLGGDEINAIISKRRAENVAAYLMEEGVKASQITTEARLDREPVAPNDSPGNRQQNRRVSFES